MRFSPSSPCITSDSLVVYLPFLALTTQKAIKAPSMKRLARIIIHKVIVCTLVLFSEMNPRVSKKSTGLA